jgi:phospholipid transport system substrate-binding protein
MIRGLFSRVWLLGLVTSISMACGGLAAASGQDAAPRAAVEKFHNTLIANMRDGAKLGFEGRVGKLAPVVDQAFDITAMARISTGARWQKMTPAEQADVAAALGAWTVASYAGNFGAWNGEAFVTKSETPDDGKGNVMVNTQLNIKGVAPVLFNYRLHQVGGTWKIFDIYLDGAISQLAMRRGEFAAVLGKGTTADLIAHMKKLAAEAKK